MALLRALIGKSLGNHIYPFEHATKDMTLREFAIPRLPSTDDLGGLVVAAEQLFERLVTVQMRLFARLAHAAEKTETALGLEPLPEPKDSASS